MDVARVGCNPAPVMLYHEHDKDQMRPKPISTEKSEEVIVHVAAGLLTEFPANADAFPPPKTLEELKKESS